MSFRNPSLTRPPLSPPHAYNFTNKSPPPPPSPSSPLLSTPRPAFLHSHDARAGNIDFDRCVATPEMMSIVGRAARILGPRGLMPNAKVGSVTRDVAAAVGAAKGGQAQFRAGKNGVLHMGVGKVRRRRGKGGPGMWEGFARSVLSVPLLLSCTLLLLFLLFCAVRWTGSFPPATVLRALVLLLAGES